MKVLLLSRYGRLGASSRLRSYQYLPFLSSHDLSITVAPLFSDNYIKGIYSGNLSHIEVLKSYLNRFKCILSSNQFDLVWVEKEMLPWLPSWLELGFLSSKTPLIVDYDDALFHRYDMHRSVVVRTLMGNKIDLIMKHANIVIVGNSYLERRAKDAGANRVEFIPTVIDLSRYKVVPTKQNGKLIIGWIGSPVTTRYLQIIKSALKTIDQKYDVQIVAIGAAKEKLKGLPVLAKAWSEKTEVEEIQQFDIGIMPLPDEPFEHGKCGYKLIQYMACGKPVIASPIGVNSEIIEPGENGFLAKGDNQWFDALSKLLNDSSLREKLGSAGRILVEKKYCMKKTGPKLLSLINEFR